MAFGAGTRSGGPGHVFQKVLEGAVIVLVTAMALLVVLGVVFRKSGAALVWYDEVASILLAWLTYYGAALVTLSRGHIGVPVLIERLRGPARTCVVLAGEVAVIAFFVVLAWAGMQVQSALGGTALVSLPGVPAALAQSVIPIGAVLCIVAQLLSLGDVLRGEGSRGEVGVDL